MSVSVELVWATYCPNAEESRSLIRDALGSLNLPERWSEWEVGDRHMPPHCQGYGSPTIFVNGVDVLNQGRTEWTTGCAVYSNIYNMRGVPTLEELIGALTVHLKCS